jgi:hypothetical protein
MDLSDFLPEYEDEYNFGDFFTPGRTYDFSVPTATSSATGKASKSRKSPRNSPNNQDLDEIVNLLNDEIPAAVPRQAQPSNPAPVPQQSQSSIIPAPVLRQSQPQTQPSNSENTFNGFFTKIGKYLNNEPVEFNGLIEERTKFIILQTLERIEKENRIKRIQANETFGEISESEKEELQEWTKSKSIFIIDSYTDSENTKKVSNNSELEKNKYAEGYKKRLTLQITEDSTKMTREKFREIFENTKNEVFPVYKMLYVKKYEKDSIYLADVRRISRNLSSKSDSYLYKIFDDYEERKAEIASMIAIDMFQVNNGKEYLYFTQIQRFNYFDKEKAQKVRNQSFNLDKSGNTYKNKIKDIISNIKAFLHGGDDMIMKKWYEDRNRVDKYEEIKNEWHAFIGNNSFKIKTYYIEINGTIYEYERTFDDEYDDVCKTVNPIVDFDNLFKFLRDFNDRREDVRRVRSKISDIFRKDIDNFKNDLIDNGQNLIFTRQLSRYEIMLLDEQSARNGLRGLDEDKVNSILKKLEFVGKSKKAVRSRSLRPIRKKGDEDATEDDEASVTEDGVKNKINNTLKNDKKKTDIKTIRSSRKNVKK